MENNDNIKEMIKLRIAMSKFRQEYMPVKNEVISINKKIVIAACAFILLTGGVVIACKNIIRYNPQNGKPIIYVGEEVPEELKGKEVILAIPEEPTKTDYFPNLKNILNKYYDFNKVEEICEEAQMNGIGNEDKLTSEGGKKLYNLIYEVFQEGKSEKEDKETILEYLQNLDNSAMNLEEIEVEIMTSLFPIPEEDSYWETHKDLEMKAIILEAENNISFLDILYKYYNKEEIDNILEKINLEHSSISDMYGLTEYSEKIVQYMIDLIKNEDVSDDEKIILEYRARLTIRQWHLNNEDLENQLDNL